jgi:hypothetical protein
MPIRHVNEAASKLLARDGGAGVGRLLLLATGC